jgi:type VII secretion-associated serine protease mycosin
VTPLRTRTVATAFAAVALALVPAAPAQADSVREAQWHLPFLQVARAHAVSQGEGVVVAVVDSGVDAQHPDLVSNVLPGKDLIDPNAANGWTDNDGHGTGMAGLIAAHGHDNGAGALGIAPKAEILPIRVGVNALNLRVPEGIEWSVDHGARVICLALGGGVDPQLAQALDHALRRDVIVVAAAGNRPNDSVVEGLARYPGVIAAAGVDRNGAHAQESVTGPEVVLAAPSDDIVSTSNDGKYRSGTGTSDSTAIIAGAAALVRAKYPNLSAAEVAHRLTATAIDKGPPGRDDEYGYGIVNLVGALTADVPPLSPPAKAAPPRSDDRRTTAILIAALVAALLLGAGGFALMRHRRTPRTSRTARTSSGAG